MVCIGILSPSQLTPHVLHKDPPAQKCQVQWAGRHVGTYLETGLAWEQFTSYRRDCSKGIEGGQKGEPWSLKTRPKDSENGLVTAW